MKIKVLKIALIILFIGCLLDMPYGYFQLVRFIGMILFGVLFLRDNNNILRTFWIISAVLINPFFKISLGRTIWNIIDIVWVLVIIISLFFPEKIFEGGKNGS